VIGIDQFERRLVEFDAAGRAGQRHPELLVELAERRQVGAGVEAHLVEAAGPEEAPDMRAGRGSLQKVLEHHPADPPVAAILPRRGGAANRELAGPARCPRLDIAGRALC
jgi:hypothetical protein